MSDGHMSEDIPECPLCLEPFALDDINFYPCACRYQICRFCWHRIRTDENGLCPHCREPYSENPAEYTPPSQEQLVKLKHDKKQKTHDKKQKLIESRKNLSSLRVVQKNLVFVIGLSPRLAEPDTLRKNEYFGKYGKIYKVVINNSTVYNGAQGPSVSAYVTYYREEDAFKAIQAVNNAFIDGRHLKASYGTTKYCTYFLRGSQCTKPDCMYLHEIGNEEASFTKEDMQAGKHQVFESQTLAAAHPGGGGQGGQGSSSKKQDQLVKGTKEQLDIESALPATASWGTRQGGGGLLPLPQMSKETKTGRHGKSQKSKHKSSDGSSSKSGGRGPRSGPLSPHSGTGAGSDSSTARRHNSTGSRMDHGSSGTRATSITRSNSTAASSSSKSVSPNLSPKSSLSTSSSSGSLKQDGEALRAGGGGGGEGDLEPPGEGVETVSGKPHPLESAISRQLDSIDLDEIDDWGLQEVRTSVTKGTVSTASDMARQQQTGVGGVRSSSERVNVLSSLGSAATGQFGSLGVSWNSGASLPSHSPVPGGQTTAVPTQTQRPLERKQTPDDDLGFDPWDVSTRGLAALLETEQKPPHPHPSSSSSSSSSAVNGVGQQRGRGGLSSAVTLDSSTNLSWQDELKSVFPNVNISFGVPPSSAMTAAPQPVAPTTTPSTTPSVFPSSLSSSSSSSSTSSSSSSSSSTAQSQTPLQQAINGATQSLAFPYHHMGVGGMGGLFGYTTPAHLQAMSEYRSLYDAAALSSQLTAARTAFETPKIPPTTSVSSTSSLLSSSTSNPSVSSTTTSSVVGKDSSGPLGASGANGALLQGKGFPGAANTIDWPELASSNQPAVGSKRGGGGGGGGGGGKASAPAAVSSTTNNSSSSTTGTGTGVLLNSNVGTWNGTMGNGNMGNGTGTAKDSTGASGNPTPATVTRSKDSSTTGGGIAPPPGFASKSGKEGGSGNMTLNSSVNHALWNNSLGKAGGVGTGQQQPNPAMASQILQNWAKYLQMNFGGLTPQQLAANPLYQQMVRQQQQYWAMLRQQQLLHLQQAAAAGVSAVPGRPVLTPAQLQQLQARMVLSQSILNQATAHARLQQQQQFLQQTLQQSQQQQQQAARNGLGQVGSVPTTAVSVSGASSTVSLGQAVRLGQSQMAVGAAGPGSGVLLKPNSQSGRPTLQQQQQQQTPSQKVPSK